MKTVLFIILLTVIANATTLTSFSEVENSPFGKSLLNLVDLNLKMKNDFSDISKLLTQIKGELTTAQRNDDAQFKIDDAKCKANIKTRKNEVTTYENSIATLKHTKQEKEKTLGKKTTQLGLDVKAHKAATDELDLKIKEDVAARAAYDDKVKKLKEAIAGCKKALSLLSSLPGGQSLFIQLSNKMDLVRQALADSLPKFANKFSPILEALSQINTKKLDPALVKQVIGLIDKLQKTLEDELTVTQKTESDRRKRHADYLVKQHKKISNLQKSINQLKKDIIKLGNAIKALGEQITRNEDLLKQARDLLAQEEKRCKRVVEIYNNDTKTRTGELKIVDELIAHFNSKINSASKDVKKAVANQSNQ